jgi:hypothetical protein
MTFVWAKNMWLTSSWGSLSLFLALFTVLGVARTEVWPPTSPDIMSAASFFTYDFAIVAAIGSFIRREKPLYPAALGLLVLIVGSLFMPGGLACLPLFLMMSIMLVASWWGLAATAGFVLLLWLLRTISSATVRSTDHDSSV